MDFKVDILKHPTDDDWMICKQCTLVTIGKEAKQRPTEEWKHKILASEHSPIRTLQFVFRITNIPYWVSVHLCRHAMATPFVKTQRNDRQENFDRNSAPQDSPVDMCWCMNAQELMNIAHKRLCNQASPETREVVAENLRGCLFLIAFIAVVSVQNFSLVIKNNIKTIEITVLQYRGKCKCQLKMLKDIMM